MRGRIRRLAAIALAAAAVVLGVTAAAATSEQNAPGNEDPRVEHPDVAPFEGDVAAQLAAGRGRLEALRSGPAADGAALAAAYGELGRLYHAYGLRAPAEACYRNAARLAPADSRWPHLLGALLQDGGRLDDAAAAYERALALAGGDTAAELHLGEIRRLQGRPEDAEAVVRKALAAAPASPADPAALALLGQTALDRHRYREAADLLTAALERAPDAGRLQYLLAQAYRGLGDRERAAEHLARAGPVGVRPADPLVDELAGLRAGERVRVARGKTAFDAGRFAEAAEEFGRALAARPESVEARIDLAAALVRLGRAGEAETELREALRLDPSNATAHFDLGTLLAAKPATDATDAADATAHLAAAARALPRDAGIHRALAHLLRASGRRAEALGEYARAVELDPADDTIRLEEAETLVRLARYREAREHLEDGLRALPASGLLAHGLARLLAACPDLALRDGGRARELAAAVWQARPTPEHAETLALAEAETGRCAEAARWQRTALAAASPGGSGSPGVPGTPGTSDPAAAARREAMRAALARYERGAPCRPGG